MTKSKSNKSKNRSKRKIAGVLFILVGLTAIGFAVGLHLSNVSEENAAGKASERTAQTLLARIAENKGTPAGDRPGVSGEQTASPDQTGNNPGDVSDEETAEPEGIEIGGEYYIGVLDIPALGLQLPVNGSWSYPKLRATPCRYTGSAADGALTIAAHNYRTHFGKIDTLQIGDELTFTDEFGAVYRYYVAEIEEIEPTRVEKVTRSGYELTLFTCNYGGNIRIVVKCRGA